MAKGASAKAQHMVMKPIEGPGFSLRGHRSVGDCDCGGKLILAKIAGIGGSRMGSYCVGRDPVKAKSWAETEDGKTVGEEISEKQFQQAVRAASVSKDKPGVMEIEVIARGEIKSCGAILGRGRGNIFGAA